MIKSTTMAVPRTVFVQAALVTALLVGGVLAAPQSALAGHDDGYGQSSYGQSSQARASVDLNMRYGPSTDYYVIDVIPAGRTVDIVRCLPARDWCEVRYRGDTGWSSSRYLYNSRYDRGYDRWDARDLVVAFDFFANIFDHDRDRRQRHGNYRHGRDYYDHVRHHGRRGHDGWGHHDRGRSGRHGDRDHDGRYDSDDRHDRYDRDGRGRR